MAGVMGNPIGDKSYYLQKDLNNLTANGIYVCYYTQGDRVNEAHYPDTASTYFQIVVYRTVSWIKQTATNVNSLETFVRVKDGDKDWSTWQRIDNFGYNSLAELAGGVASEMSEETRKVSIPAGGSVDITPTAGYAVFSMVSSSSTSVILGAISGSNVHEIFRHQSSKLVVEKGSEWGSFKVTNTSASAINLSIHIFY